MTIDIHKKVFKNSKINKSKYTNVIVFANIIYLATVIILLFTAKWYISVITFIISIFNQKAVNADDDVSMIIFSLLCLFTLITYYI